MLRDGHLASTARIPLNGTLVVTTGHVGLNLKTGEFVTDTLENEFNAVLDCLDAALRNAGVAKGLGKAHKLNSFFTRAEDEPVFLRAFHERFPDNTPTMTNVVVAGLANPGVHVEVQAEAVADS